MHSDVFILFVHYHLNGGGVTKVIEQQSGALTKLGIPHLVLCGENTSNSSIPQRIIPGLEYVSKEKSQFPEITAASLLEKITSVTELISKTHEGAKVIFHFHNHSIGLNYHYDELVSNLAHHFPLLLQIHDFIEDGRTQNRGNIGCFQKLYPKANHIQYCTINSRDKKILNSAGVTADLLPNTLATPARQPASTQKKVFYPIQALRRKNLGELLLIAMASPAEYSFQVALTPPESIDLVNYWSAIAQRLELPIVFGDSNLDATAFRQHYETASHIVTTSIQEGFGMTYIDPVYFQKPLFGRDLPEITIDLKNAGLHHPNLYTSIEIQFPDLQHEDFGNLNEVAQTHILQQIALNPTLLNHIVVHLECVINGARSTISIKEYLEKVYSSTTPLPLEVIEPWTLQNVQSQLADIYQKLAQSSLTKVTHLDYAQIDTFFSQRPKHALKNAKFTAL
ncbi:hypothetical protein OAB00_01735 [Akkermansiaceae bacterium]|nr:hypothetical protein [Akkermansiaceae bacterium]